MLKGIHLTLFIGKVVTTIAPKEVMDALQSIQVTNSKETSGFQLSFSIGSMSSLSLNRLPAGYFDPITTRIIIVVTVNGQQQVLMDGFITNQELTPSSEPGQSNLTITGQDLSLIMDLVQVKFAYPAMPEVAIINLVLAKYAFLGVIPLVIPPFIPNMKNPTQGYNAQNETDRAYIKRLAQKAGFIFFIQPGPSPGKSIAYFGPDINLPIPQAAVSINWDAHSNAESLSFSLDGLAKKVKVFLTYDPITKKIPIPIPTPNINLFKPPLGARATPPANISFSDKAAAMTLPEVGQAVLGFMLNNNAAVTGNGSIDVTKYNQILRARMLLAVRGAGTTYDGYYYVDSVTHNIKKGEYKQSFTISRDGLGARSSIVNV